MVKVDTSKCKKCGVCLSTFGNYCMKEADGFPVVDREICNRCQKCIALCPHQAISMNGVFPAKMSNAARIGYRELQAFLSLRRSTKSFKDRRIPDETIEMIARSAGYAPDQNKNIGILVVNDHSIIDHIDSAALGFFETIHRVMFSFRPVTSFIGLFSKSLPVIRRKMERDLFHHRRIVKRNTDALLLAIGETRIPVTETSAQYLLATMILTAVSLDIGCTLMDSLKLTINNKRRLRKRLGLKPNEKVLGVLALGYSDEKIMNIPKGYEVPVYWNKRK
jgi:NAD-dependent dihydropyrimidine dehydrogenase PreA subunit/nitroreductase